MKDMQVGRINFGPLNALKGFYPHCRSCKPETCKCGADYFHPDCVNMLDTTDEFNSSRKDTNPKDAVGVRKVPFSCIPMNVLWGVGVAMMEGALKYGRHNYRVSGVRASVYFDAVVGRHLVQWWEGEDIDAESGRNHIDKAIACLFVLRDSMMRGTMVDDRPPKSDMAHLHEANANASALIDKFPCPVPAFTEVK